MTGAPRPFWFRFSKIWVYRSPGAVPAALLLIVISPLLATVYYWRDPPARW